MKGKGLLYGSQWDDWHLPATICKTNPITAMGMRRHFRSSRTSASKIDHHGFTALGLHAFMFSWWCSLKQSQIRGVGMKHIFPSTKGIHFIVCWHGLTIHVSHVIHWGSKLQNTYRSRSLKLSQPSREFSETRSLVFRKGDSDAMESTIGANASPTTTHLAFEAWSR